MSKLGDMPAFPRPSTVFGNGSVYDAHINGMTLRQYYAGLAIQGCATASGHQGLDWKRAAQESVRAADALLAELEKP